MATLINGNGNSPVTAQQDADLYQGILGGDFVKMLPIGSQMAYTIEDANTITIADGECIDSEGRRIHTDIGYEDTFTIPTGTSGVTAYYIIGYYISTDSDGNETASTFVQAMSSSTATIGEGSLRDGDSSKYVSLYRVTQTSLAISSVEALFTTLTGLTGKLDGTTLVSDYDTAVTTTTTGTAPDCTVIAEMYENFLDGCSTLAAALNSAGVATASNASPSVMAAAIATVANNHYASGYAAAKVGTATANRVLANYTFTNASNVGIAGNMTNRGNVTVTLNCGSSYTITNGFHGGGGTVTANSLSSQTSANATAARLLNAYTAWVNGSKITGSMNNWGSNTVTLSSSNTATRSAGYYSSISINAAGRYSAGYNAGYNAVSVKQMAVFAARGFGASSSDYESSNSNSYTMTANGTVYYALFSCGYDGANVVNVVYVNNSAQVSRNISSDYAWRNTNGSFSANSGAVIKIVTNATAGSHAAGYCTVAIKY